MVGRYGYVVQTVHNQISLNESTYLTCDYPNKSVGIYWISSKTDLERIKTPSINIKRHDQLLFML